MRQRGSVAILSLLAGALVLFSCNEKKPITEPYDETAPKIIMTSPKIMAVGSYDSVANLDTFRTDIRFEDDMELKSYEITIRYRQDLIYADYKTTNDPWNETYYGDLSGNVGGFNQKITVPYDPDAGPYEFKVKVKDAAGNETTVSTYLFVSNGADMLYPTIQFQAPDTNTVDTFIIGQDIAIKALTYDPPGFGQVDRVDAWVSRSLSKEKLTGSVMVWDSLPLLWTLDTIYTIPAGTAPGDYEVNIFCRDFHQNISHNSDHIYIKPF